MNFGEMSKENGWKGCCHQMTCEGRIKGIWQRAVRIFMVMPVCTNQTTAYFGAYQLLDYMICFDNLVDFFPNKMTPDILTPLSLDLPFLQQHIHVCCSLWHCMPAKNPPCWLKLTRHLNPLIEGWAAHQSRSSDMGTIWYQYTTSQ